MIGIDTNVLIRHLTEDDAIQSAIAHRFLERLTPNEPGFVSAVTLAELWWVFTTSFKYPRELRISAISELLESKQLVFSDPDLIASALADARSGADLADAIIARQCLTSGAATVATFDKGAIKHAGMTAVEDLLAES
jgi:predicted nucleic-acid-binding protein